MGDLDDLKNLSLDRRKSKLIEIEERARQEIEEARQKIITAAREEEKTKNAKRAAAKEEEAATARSLLEQVEREMLNAQAKTPAQLVETAKESAESKEVVKKEQKTPLEQMVATDSKNKSIEDESRFKSQYKTSLNEDSAAGKVYQRSQTMSEENASLYQQQKSLDNEGKQKDMYHHTMGDEIKESGMLSEQIQKRFKYQN